MGIQINGNTNNINAGIGSLSIEDLREIDIVGVATAANFKTGVSNLHNVGLTLSGGQIDVGSNIKLGNAGVITATTFVGNLTGTATQVSLDAQSFDTDCYPVFSLDATGNQALYTKSNRLSFNSATGALSATSFVGDGSNLTGITQTTISGNANNRIITGSGTANTLNGESTFTYDGDGLLSMTSTSGSAEFTIVGPNNTDSGIYFNDGANDGAISYDHSTRQLKFRAGGHTRMYFAGGNDSNNNVIYLSNASYDDGIIQFWNGGLYLKTGSSSGDKILSFNTAGSERLRINSSGELWVGTTSGVSNSGYGGISLNGSNGSLLSLMQNGTEYLRLFGDSNPAIQFAGVLRLFSGVSGGSAIWGISPNGTTTGANSVTFNLKSTIQHTVGVMAVSSSYNSGDLYIRIDNIYNLAGNAWWTFGLWIMTNQTVGTLAGHHSAMVHVYITGLGSWSSITTTNIQGSMAGSVSIDQHGTNFVELKLDANNSSRGPCTVLCNGGTFDPPRISFH